MIRHLLIALAALLAPLFADDFVDLGVANRALPPMGANAPLGLAPQTRTVAQAMTAAAFVNLNADAITTFSRTTGAWDDYSSAIKYANQRRQRTFTVAGTNYSADLIESPRTNLLAAGTSEHFERWTVGSGTPVVTTDTLACPNAEVVADTLTEGVGTGTQGVSQSITKAASSITYAGSCYVKNKTGSRDVAVDLDDGTLTNGVQMRINPATGALTAAPAAFGTGWSSNTSAGTSGYTITAVGSWWRVTLVATSDSTTTVRFRVALYNAADSYAGNGTSAIYLWGADVDAAPFSGSVALNRNILLSSETLGTNWSASRGSVSSNTTADPITGNVTADTFTEDNTATNTHALIQAITKPSSAAFQYTYSVYLKPSGRSWVLVRLTGTSDTNGKGVYFDVTNGVKGSTDTTGAGTTLDASSITSAGGGWYRCSITVTSDATAAIRPALLSASADNGKTYTGTTTACYIAWGAQLEYGPTVTQYWATVTTTGTRAIDVLSSDVSGLSGGGLSVNSGTLVSIVMPSNWTGDQDGSTIYRLWTAIDTTPFSRVARAGATTLSCIREDSGVGDSVSSTLTHNLTSGALSQVSTTWNSGGAMGLLNGATAGTASAAPVVPYLLPTSVKIGSNSTGAGNQFCGYDLCLYSAATIPGSDLALINANTTAP